MAWMDSLWWVGKYFPYGMCVSSSFQMTRPHTSMLSRLHEEHERPQPARHPHGAKRTTFPSWQSRPRSRINFSHSWQSLPNIPHLLVSASYPCLIPAHELSAPFYTLPISPFLKVLPIAWNATALTFNSLSPVESMLTLLPCKYNVHQRCLYTLLFSSTIKHSKVFSSL
jgi:hypothetical protein